jgi:hypothetical protein
MLGGARRRAADTGQLGKDVDVEVVPTASRAVDGLPLAGGNRAD